MMVMMMRICRRKVETATMSSRRSVTSSPSSSSSSSLHTDISRHRRAASTIPRYHIDFSRIQKVSDAVFLFDDMLRMRPSPSLRDLCKLLKFVVKMKDYSLALHMFDEMRQCSFAYNEYTLNIEINCYCLLNRVDLGFSIFGMFIKSGLAPNVTTFNTLIRGLFLNGKGADAVLLFNKLSRENLCKPDEITFNTVIDYYCTMNRGDLGFSVLGTFLKSGLVPNVITFSTLIKGLFLDDKGDDALLLFKKLSRENLSEPNEVTFGTVIDGLCKLGNVHIAVCLLGILVKGSCKPHVQCYNPIIDSLCKDGMLDHALQLFSKMDGMGIRPDVFTYSSILQGLCDLCRWKEAKDLLNKMMSHGVRPNVLTYSILIIAFAKEGKMKEAKSTLAVMMRRNIAPNIVTYNSLIDGYVMRGEMEKAMEVFNLILDFGLQPDIITYNTMLHGFCQGGLLKEAMYMFAEMVNNGPQPNVTTFTTIICGLLQYGLLKETKRMLVEMENCGCVDPDHVTFYVIVKGCLRQDELQKAQPLLKEMRSKCLLLETANVHMLLDHCIENGGDGVPLDIIEKLLELN